MRRELAVGWGPCTHDLRIHHNVLPEGPGRLHHFIRGDAGDINGDGDDGPGQAVLLQGAPDHVPRETELSRRCPRTVGVSKVGGSELDVPWDWPEEAGPEQTTPGPH